MPYLSPKSSAIVKVSHQLSMLSCHGLIVVMNEQPEGVGAQGPEILFKARNYLLERLFINAAIGSDRIKVQFVDAFSEQASERPS